MKNNLLRFEIYWTKPILQEFWKGNRIYIKQKWSEWRASKNGQFAMLIVNHLTNANVSFLGFYYQMPYNKTKEKWKNKGLS